MANSRGPQTLTQLAEETGATPVRVEDAARDAEIVAVTVPVKAAPNLPSRTRRPEPDVPDQTSGLLDGAAGAVAVVDTGNSYPRQRDGRIDAIEDEGLTESRGTESRGTESRGTESRGTERQIGHPVIKAFNGTFAQDLLDRARPEGSSDRLALPVAGDDPAAKGEAMGLVEEMGFDTVDAGGLDDFWRQQPGTPVYGLRADSKGVIEELAAAGPERGPEFRG
ncbi:NADPH-dependent F420 reductase [Streptomyces sp. bgisy034]|uniref:NADPH-dependent F420 reductase n=1 Tax=Streptomyces sp. bgisy034 TaxID=3413774 RepID=UPI003EB79014